MVESRDFVVAPGLHHYWDLRQVVSLSPSLVVSFHPGYLTSTVEWAWCAITIAFECARGLIRALALLQPRRAEKERAGLPPPPP